MTDVVRKLWDPVVVPGSEGGRIALDFRGVGKTYPSDGGDVTAVKDLTLTVQKGEFLTIVGPSGCGKSTLLNLLVGLERPTAGEILLDGAPSYEQRTKIGYVMQQDNLYPWRTLQQNVEFPLEIRGVDAKRRSEISRGYLARVHLSGFEDKYPHQLSGGMRQRGNIVRALSFSPDVIIMDEPFGALDAQTRVLLQQQLLELWQQEKKTVVFITHDLQEAIALGDRVLVLTSRPGRIKSIHDVGIPRPRDVRHMHENARFRDLLSIVGAELADELAAAASGGANVNK